MGVNARKISIIIPTLNAGPYLRQLLEVLTTQSLQPEEILVVDSESNDDTESIVRETEAGGIDLRFLVIKRESFRHGPTRNFAASQAIGEILVFLTQDARPSTPEWLASLTSPFRDPAVSLVFGRHIPWPGGNPIIARDINNHFASFGPDEYCLQQVDWACNESVQKYHANAGRYCFNSNVNSAIRQDVWNVIKFRDVSYCEDQLFGKDVIESGRLKVYSKNATVFHSHDYSIINYLKRYFDEYRGLKVVFGRTNTTNIFSFIPIVVAKSILEMVYLARADISNKVYWMSYAPFYYLARTMGALLGERHEKLPHFLRMRLSLEGRG